MGGFDSIDLAYIMCFIRLPRSSYEDSNVYGWMDSIDLTYISSCVLFVCFAASFYEDSSVKVCRDKKTNNIETVKTHVKRMNRVDMSL